MYLIYPFNSNTYLGYLKKNSTANPKVTGSTFTIDNLKYSFDKNEVYKKYISTLRPGGSELESYESEIVEVAEDACNKLINHLEYTSGVLTVYFEAPGQMANWNKERSINVNIHIVLNRNVYPTNESYNDIQEYTNQIMSFFKEYNILRIMSGLASTAWID